MACSTSEPPSESPPVDDTVDPSLREVAFFQTVAVPVWVAPEVVPSAERTAPIVANRDAVVRALVEAGDTLSVEITSGGAPATFVGAGDDGALLVELPAASLTSDATYVVRVLEGDVETARFPASSEASLDAITTGPLRVRLVPFEVAGFVPDTSPEVIDGFRQALLAGYPITDALLEVAPVEVWTAPFDLGDINVRVGELQESAMYAGEVDWNVYYYGLVTGVASRDGWTGSTGTSESGGDGPLSRAFFAAGAAFGDEKAEGTLLHELGHVHGLGHAPCDGEDDVDPDFPYPDGTIGVEGYDRRTAAFLPADTKDLMTYCEPRWVSDYDLAKMATHVVNAQDYAGYR